jgi:uncharacterized protein
MNISTPANFYSKFMKKEIQSKIADLFKNDKEIAAVYLFGSHAKNNESAKSDIDLGFLFNEKLSSIESYKMLQNYFVKLSRFFGKEYDLVDMERINFVLLFEIIRDGKILIENNRKKNRHFKAQKIVQYFDFEYILKQCATGMFRKAMEKQGG